ncbi:MAG: RNA polymerase sigma factor [Bacteroidota bacterium]
MYLTPEDNTWEQAYAEHADELRAFALARLDEADAEDLLQEVWAALATSLETTTITQPRAWLYRVLRNRITDLLRRASGRPAFQDLTPEFDAVAENEYAADPDELWDEIEDALDQLPEDQREVFVRNELDGETLREIAEDLSLPLKTVISRKGYARRRLQDILQEVYDDYFAED